MEKQDFIKRWNNIGDLHLHLDKSNIDLFDFGKVAVDFLFELGMPSEFLDLNFDYLKERKLESVNQKWSLENPVYEKYLAIGFNGSGDPIAINLENQELIYLNHDNSFEEVFINSNLNAFAFSALTIQSFVEQMKKLNTESLFTTEFSDEQYEKLIHDLKNIDPKIFETKKSQWNYTLEYFKCERDEERSTAANMR